MNIFLCRGGESNTRPGALPVWTISSPQNMGAGRFRSDVNRRVLLKRIVSTPSSFCKEAWLGILFDMIYKPFPEFTQLHFRITAERPEDSGVCSTTELPRHGILFDERWTMQDSNLQPLRCKRSALPIELIVHGILCAGQ